MLQTNTDIKPASLVRLTSLSLLFILMAGMASAQWYKTNCPRLHKQAEVWYFGEKSGIDFRSGAAVPLTDQNVMTALKSSSSICDSGGNFQFLTNGRQVWDRSFTLMPNATALAGRTGATQPCIIVPVPRNSNLYYVFTLDIITFNPDSSSGLSYSMIDMAMNGGAGDATNMLNIPLLTPVCQKITAVNNSDSTGTWVIVHKWESDMFYAYLVDHNGMRDPVTSKVGSIHGGGASNQINAEGFMKASPNGKKLALAITGEKKVELFDFDNKTGIVSNGKTYTATAPGVDPNGIEFSPDSKMLYAILYQRGGSGPPTAPSLVYQFDISTGQLNNPVLVGSANGIRLGSMQLAPDGRIYISRTVNLQFKRDSLDVIYNPTRPGTACNYNMNNHLPDNRFSLTTGRFGLYSLPNFNQSYFNLPPFTWDSVCHGDVTRFHITNKANIDSVRWDFGDGGSSNIMDPMHAYASPGKYMVKKTEIFNGQLFTDSILVTSYPVPSLSLADTVLLYTGSSVYLHAGGGFSGYLWSTGAVDSTINVNEQGAYFVNVIDANCCVNADTTYVKVFKYFVPNAFSPNGDGLNDTFGVYALYTNIIFKMTIYNRWGELVFQADNINDVWDGTNGGVYCEPDSYVWLVNIGFQGQDIVTDGDVVLKGTVTIVR